MLIISRRARGDLASIYARLKTVAGVATAKRYLANLRRHLERIARLGHGDAPRNKVQPRAPNALERPGAHA